MRFRVDYVDPADGAAKSKFVELDDTVGIPAIVRAEDYAFSIAKGSYYVVTPDRRRPG